MKKIASYKVVIRDNKKVVERDVEMSYELASILTAQATVVAAPAQQ